MDIHCIDMNRLCKFSLILLTATVTTCSCSTASDEPKPDGGKIDLAVPCKGVDFADPFVLLDGDTYYAYGTYNDDGITCFSSTDLKNWKKECVALSKDNSYADHWFWAPEVYKVGNRYLMFYSADEHTCIAESNSPIGPFRQRKQEPLITTEKTIDSTLFTDDDGTHYIYFCRFNTVTNGETVWCAKFDTDNLTYDPETLTLCIRPDDEAWVYEMVNEGTAVVKHGDTYYLTYSGNGYMSPNYGIGYATAKSPMGPWKKYSGNPIFIQPTTQKWGRLEGIGHHAFFKDKEGKDRIVFHAHNKPRTVHPRQMYFSTYSFTDDPEPVMQISTSDITKALTND